MPLPLQLEAFRKQKSAGKGGAAANAAPAAAGAPPASVPEPASAHTAAHPESGGDQTSSGLYASAVASNGLLATSSPALSDGHSGAPEPVTSVVPPTLPMPPSMALESAGGHVGDPAIADAGGAGATHGATHGGQPTPAVPKSLDPTVQTRSDCEGTPDSTSATVGVGNSDGNAVQRRAAVAGGAPVAAGVSAGGIRFQQPAARPAVDQLAVQPGGIPFRAPAPAVTAAPWLPPPPPTSTLFRDTRSGPVSGELPPAAVSSAAPAASPADAATLAAHTVMGDAAASVEDPTVQDGAAGSGRDAAYASRETSALPVPVINPPNLPALPGGQTSPQLGAGTALGAAQLSVPHAEANAEADSEGLCEQRSPAAALPAPPVHLSSVHGRTAPDQPSADSSESVSERSEGLQMLPRPGQQARDAPAPKTAARSLFGGFLRSAAKAIAPPPPPAPSPANSEPQHQAEPVLAAATSYEAAVLREAPLGSMPTSAGAAEALAGVWSAAQSPPLIGGTSVIPAARSAQPSPVRATWASPARPVGGDRGGAHPSVSGLQAGLDGVPGGHRPQQRGTLEPPSSAAQVSTAVRTRIPKKN